MPVQIRARGTKVLARGTTLLGIPAAASAPIPVATVFATAASFLTNVPIATVLATGGVLNGDGSGPFTLTSIPPALVAKIGTSNLSIVTTASLTAVPAGSYDISWRYEEAGYVTIGTVTIILAVAASAPTAITSNVGASFSIPDDTPDDAAVAILGLNNGAVGSGSGGSGWSITGSTGSMVGRASVSATTGASVMLILDAASLVAGNTGTVTVAYSGEGASLSLTLTITAAAVSGAGTLATISLANTVASTSTGYVEYGLAFPKAMVTSSQIVQARLPGGADLPTGMGNIKRWGDGSLQRCTAYVSASTVAASATKTVEVYAKTGSVAASSFNPAAWVAAHANDWTCSVTNIKGSTAPTTVLGSASFSAKAAVATAARCRVWNDTAVAVDFRAWQVVSAFPHLVCIFQWRFWLNSAGTAPVAVRYKRILQQPWWVNNPFGVVSTKEKYVYDADDLYGTSRLGSAQINLQHAYYTSYCRVRDENDEFSARGHWVNISGSDPMPTLLVKYSIPTLQMFARARYVAPLRFDQSYQEAGLLTYTPFGTGEPQPHGHRPGFGSSGSYPARGWHGNFDSIAQSMQTASTIRKARIGAMAGHSMWHWVRDHRTVGGDASFEIIPYYFRQIIANTYPNLPAPVIAVHGTITGAAPTTVMTESKPNGGTGAWPDYNAAHAMNFSGWMAFYEGEPDMIEAAMMQLDIDMRSLNWNAFAHDAHLLYESVPERKAANSIPSTDYGQMPDVRSQARSLGNTLNIIREAWCAVPDNHPAALVIKDVILNVEKYLSDSWAYLPTSGTTPGALQRARGGAWWVGNGEGTQSLFESNFQQIFAYSLHTLCGEFLPTNARGYNGYQETAVLDARITAKIIRNYPYSLLWYKYGYWADGTCTILTDDDLPWGGNQNNVVPISGNTVNWTPAKTGLALANGDHVYFIHSAAHPVPTGITRGRRYYMVGVSGQTFQVSATLGGSAMPLDKTNGIIHVRLASCGTVTPYKTDGSVVPTPDDSFMPIAFSALEYAFGNGHADISSGDITAARTFWAPWVNQPNKKYAAWNYDGNVLLGP